MTAYTQDAVLGGLTTGQRHRQSLCQAKRHQYLPPRAVSTVEHEPYQRDKVRRRGERAQLAVGVPQAGAPGAVVLDVSVESFRRQIVL